MPKPLYIRVITGFRKDQGFSLNAEEAHKAYYLFLNPDKRGVFSNGVAVRGSDIQKIIPDYVATMGWNEGYTPNEFDWKQIESKGLPQKIQKAMFKAKQLAEKSIALDKPMSEAVNALPESDYKSLEGSKEVSEKLSV